MNQLKEQLEERTRILQADIKTQQQELHDIKEKLQLANLQVARRAVFWNEFFVFVLNILLRRLLHSHQTQRG